MKINFKVVLLVISFLVFVFSMYQLWGAYTSLKYEVDEAIIIRKVITDDLRDKEKYLRALIDNLWILSSYSFISLIVIAFSLNNVKKILPSDNLSE